MSRQTTPPLPAVARVLIDLGRKIRLARQRRGLPAELLAERAGMSRPTLRAIERGDASVTLGAVTNVLHSLGLEGDLALVARDDQLGRKLQDAGLEAKRRVRVPKIAKGGAGHGR
jgi:transcriptional regulator with XRE-family HTH domain